MPIKNNEASFLEAKNSSDAAPDGSKGRISFFFENEIA